jgi:hypothetical protein
MQRIERHLANDDRSHALGNVGIPRCVTSAELREIARPLWNNSGRKF